MTGKALLMVVVGFSLIYLVMGKNFGSITYRGLINSVDYYNETMAHNIAVSGAKMAANQIFFLPSWRKGFYNKPYQGGKIRVIVDSTLNQRIIRSIGTYNDVIDTVTVVLQPSNFSKFSYYSVDENSILWVTGDTVWGPFHTQDYVRISGNPVFVGKVTTKKGKTLTSGSRPKFLGGYEQGVSITIPATSMSDLQNAAIQNGRNITGHDTVYATFKNDSINIKFAWNGASTTYYGPEYAPNGVIYVASGNLRIKGTVDGRYTVGASGSTKGNIYLDSSIVYKTDPALASCDDILGIVAQNNVIITDKNLNNNGISIDASIFCQTGGFTAENYGSRGIDGNINLVGGIIQNDRGAVGTVSSGHITSGFSKRYRYDDRFGHQSPPMFPNTSTFEIVSWLE